MRLLPWRFALFALVLIAALAWASANGGEHAAMVRHFLRNLLRQLF